jgi:hypothetical protein
MTINCKSGAKVGINVIVCVKINVIVCVKIIGILLLSIHEFNI